MNSHTPCVSKIGRGLHRRNPLLIAVLALANVLAVGAARSAEGAASRPVIQGARWDTLILAVDGTVWDCGQYGDYGDSDGYAVADPSAGVTRHISAGRYMGFADKKIRGYNDFGEFGVDPASIGQETTFTDLGTIAGTAVAGHAVSYVITKGGGLLAAGDNSFGQLGNPLYGAASSTFLPVLKSDGSALGEISDVAAGSASAVALDRSGNVWTWGDNTYGQLGDGSTTSRGTAARVRGLRGIVAVSAQNGYDVPGSSKIHDHTLALDASGFVWAWGENRDGDIGNGTLGLAVTNPTTDTAPVTRPQRVLVGPNQPLNRIVAIAAGGTHSLALRSDGTVWTWGYDGSGQLGDGKYHEGVALTAAGQPINSYARRVPGLRDVRRVGAGPATSFAIDAVGRVWSWGYDYHANLCLGPRDPTLSGRDPVFFISSPTLVKNRDGTTFNAGRSGPLPQF
jgi:alpha-tubulin suppressor-like RCC1 family protein